MAAKFTTPEDYQYLQQLARGTGGEEKKRQKELVDHRNQVQQEKEARRAKRARQIAEREARIERTAFIWDKKGLRALTGGSLRDMFKKFKDAGAPNMEKTKSSIKVDEIRNLLCAAVDLKNTGEWVLFGDMVDHQEKIFLIERPIKTPKDSQRLPITLFSQRLIEKG